MDLRHLRYFVAVAESLHFGQAALRLGIAQPSLSHQIRQLETELQTTLLLRTRRRVELSKAGHLFLDEARDILARTDRAALLARRAGRTSVHPLRIAVGYCMNHRLVARATCEFRQQHPNVPVGVKTMSVPAQLSALSEGRIDIGFVRPPVTDPILSHAVLVKEPLVVALPRTHRLARKTRIAVPSLADEPLILVPRDTVPVFYDAVLGACRRAGLVPLAPIEVDHLQLMLAMVSEAAGLAVVPSSAAAIGPHTLVYRPLQTSDDALETAVAWRRDERSPLLRAFVDAARRATARPTRRSPSVG